MKVIAGKTPGWQTATVYLNGAKVDRCFEADEEAGEIIIPLLDPSDPNGRRVLFDHAGFGEVVRATLRGKVEVRGIPEAVRRRFEG